ncbi:CAP domain-containing protein [Nodosilinea nodulosa]|uniref:CAP domain-containing protein n=1 Tax=Nodosilinea nodulosa TaxID=416001 RepID=UPI0002ED7848|nr:CAP domain-containing protein [Nodosilinea nodulosa]
MSCAIGNSYIVQSGDILFDVAQRELGDGNRWQEISNTNGAQLTEADARNLQIGQEICIPSAVKHPPDSSSPVAPSVVSQVLELINNERRQAGLQPLRLNAALTQAAQRHSTSMAYQDFFDHVGRDGSTFVTRIQQAGYRYSAIAENIAGGQTTASAAVQGWMNSPGHRIHILDPRYVDTGIGYEFLGTDPGRVTLKHYWTQTFGTPA